MKNPKKILEKIEGLQRLMEKRDEVFQQLIAWYNQTFLKLVPIKATKKVEYTRWVTRDEYTRLARRNLV